MPHRINVKPRTLIVDGSSRSALVREPYAECFEVVTELVDCWAKQVVFLALAKGFGIDNKLIFRINGTRSDMALDNAL